MEANHDLVFRQESFMTARRDNELVFIEKVNGKIERWVTKQATAQSSLEAFGANKPQTV